MSSSCASCEESDNENYSDSSDIQAKGQEEIEIEKQKEIEEKQKEARDICEKLIYISAIIGDLETIKFFVETHKVDLKNYRYYFHPLHQAFERGHFDIVKYLIEHGIDINYANRNIGTILLDAYSNGNTELVEYLLDKGADPVVYIDAYEFPFSKEIHDKLSKYASQIMKEEITKHKK